VALDVVGGRESSRSPLLGVGCRGVGNARHALLGELASRVYASEVFSPVSVDDDRRA
jgi:hypothetical protein